MNTKILPIVTGISSLVISGLLVFGFAFAHESMKGVEKLDDLRARLSRAEFALQNMIGTDATAEARIDVVRKNSGLFDTSVKVTVDKLMMTSGSVFEGWLVDEQSGYKLSLGGFVTNVNGHGNLKFRQNLVNTLIYDKLVITREALGDTNPSPGTTVFQGDIPSLSFGVIKTKVNLKGVNEVPPTNSTATGTAKITIDTAANTLSFDITFSGLSSAETGAHIHGPAPVGVNAPVLFALPSGSPKIGVWNYTEAQEADIFADRTYINIHSTNFPGGEIRGQIMP